MGRDMIDREEVIKAIDELLPEDTLSKEYEAVFDVLRAIYKIPSTQIATDINVGDTISRQQAIEAFEPTHYIDWYTPTIIETLEALPSVQPEVLACGSGELVEASRRLVEASPNDLISRQQAIDAMASWDWQELYLPIHFKQVLEELPSAQQEIIRCKDCKWFGEAGCAIRIVDDSDKPNEEDFCSFAERRSDED